MKGKATHASATEKMALYEKRLVAWQRARFAPPPEKPLSPRVPSLTQMVPMRDGVRYSGSLV